MTPREQSRLQVLNSLLAEHMTLDQAATVMGVSQRHARRMLTAYRYKGASALTHGLRDQRPHNATADTTKDRMLRLARTRYAGTNHTHLSELLSEREGIDIARTTLRRILVNAGLSSPRRRRPPKHRVRRQRMSQEGMLVQLDGSYHPWLGDDRPQFTLLIAVDDATGCVLNASFSEKEDARSYFFLIKGADPGPGAALWHTAGPLHRPARSLPAHTRIRVGRHVNPVQPGDGRAGDTTDIRPVAPGQGSRGASGGNVSGPAGNRTPAGRGKHH